MTMLIIVGVLIGLGVMMAVLGLAPIALVRFYEEGDERPRCEAIIAAGRFTELFEAELAALLASARPVRD